MKLFNKKCSYCGLVFTSKKREARFCNTFCRKKFNNRRMTRGAQLYDLLMELHHNEDKGIHAQLDALKKLCSLWIMEDIRLCRYSWTRQSTKKKKTR